MLTAYRTVYENGTGEIEEKKSRFIANIALVHTEEEALAFLEKIRKQYWDASHSCYAYVIGQNRELQRCSDAGEPQGTAGRPMLDVLLGDGVRDVIAVVTRYFGGTLLGTGGLVRAYSKATQEGLKNTGIIEKKYAHRLKIGTDYNGVGKIQYILGKAGITTLSSDYGADVHFEVLVPIEQIDAIQKELTEGTNGRAALELGDPIWYAVWNKEVLLFEQ